MLKRIKAVAKVAAFVKDAATFFRIVSETFNHFIVEMEKAFPDKSPSDEANNSQDS